MHAAMELPFREPAAAAQQAVLGVAPHELQAHAQRLLYELADALAAPAAAGQAADAGQLVTPAVRGITCCVQALGQSAMY